MWLVCLRKNNNQMQLLQPLNVRPSFSSGQVWIEVDFNQIYVCIYLENTVLVAV